MATFEIEANGRILEVDAPDAASAARAAQAYASRPAKAAPNVSGQSAAPAPIPAPTTPLPVVPEQYRNGKVQMQNITPTLEEGVQGANIGDKIIGGMGAAPMQAWQSIKQLMGKEVPESEVKDWRAITGTGAGATGNVLGNVAMTALPLGAAEKALRGGITHLPKALQFLKYGVVPAVAATESAALRPTTEGESRAEEAVKSGLFAGAAATGIRALGRTLSGLAKPSQLGKQLMKEDIQPTVSEGSKGIIGRTIGFGEDLMGIMGLGKGHALSNDQAMAKIREQVTPLLNKYGDEITEPISRSSGFFTEAKDRFMDGYGSILDGKNVPMPATFRTSVVKKAIAGVPGASDETVNSFQKQMGAIYSTARGSNQTAGQWKSLLNEMSAARRKAIATAGTEAQAGRLGELFDAAEKQLMDRAMKSGALTSGELDALKELNNGWAKFKLVESAALLPRSGTGKLAGAPGERLVSVDDIITASERSAPDAQRLGEKEFFASITRPMSEVLAQRAAKGTLPRQIAYGAAPGASVGRAAAMAAMSPVLPLSYMGTTKTGSKLLMGNTLQQRLMARKLRDTIYPRLGTLSAATDTDENKE